jgi:hypothetical protein
MAISERALRMRAGTDREIQARWQRERAALPNSPLSDKLYRMDKPLLSDRERSWVSKLGGVAQPTKPQRRGRR